MTGALVILGGCGGIGRQLVAQAEAAGFDPIILDLPRSIAQHPPRVRALPVDASDPDDLSRAAGELPATLAGFVNLCGFLSEVQPVLSTPPAHWSDVMDGNLSAAFHASRTLAPKIASGGAIVHVGSGLGHFARPGYGSYAIAKAGISALTRQMALELAPAIRVNCVAPSAVDTAFLRGGTGRSSEASAPPLDLQAYAQTIPLARVAQPQDVTGPILFLLSAASGYITGQTLQVNGGAYMP